MIGPNASLSVRGAWLFMGLASFATLGSAFFCTWLGFWPVLPFAGLELAAVGAALIVAMRRNRYREVVTFAAEQVVVEFGMTGEGARSRVTLTRAWARCWVEKTANLRHAPTRLLLGSSGQRVEIGGCLTDAEREQLAVRFKRLLRMPLYGGSAQEAHMTLGEH